MLGLVVSRMTNEPSCTMFTVRMQSYFQFARPTHHSTSSGTRHSNMYFQNKKLCFAIIQFLFCTVPYCREDDYCIVAVLRSTIPGVSKLCKVLHYYLLFSCCFRLSNLSCASFSLLSAPFHFRSTGSQSGSTPASDEPAFIYIPRCRCEPVSAPSFRSRFFCRLKKTFVTR